MTQTAAERKAAERDRHKAAGRVSVTVHIYPEDRPKLSHYIKRLNERAERRVRLTTQTTRGNHE